VLADLGALDDKAAPGSDDKLRSWHHEAAAAPKAGTAVAAAHGFSPHVMTDRTFNWAVAFSPGRAKDATAPLGRSVSLPARFAVSVPACVGC
jgi:hypothetical protein